MGIKVGLQSFVKCFENMASLRIFSPSPIPGYGVPPEVLLSGDIQWADLWPDGTLHDDPPPEGEHEEGGLCGQTDWNLCLLSTGGLWGQPTLTNFPHFSLLSASNLTVYSDMTGNMHVRPKKYL